jgi:hypothetical protein
MKDKDWNEGEEAQSSGGAVPSSGGEVLTRTDILKIIDERKPISESELRKALEWKPWYTRYEESPKKRPESTSEDYHDHMSS